MPLEPNESAELTASGEKLFLPMTTITDEALDHVRNVMAENEKLREQLVKRTEALEAAQKVLQALTSPVNRHLSSAFLWTQAVAVETRARKALTDEKSK